jgi:hypothetical protein
MLELVETDSLFGSGGSSEPIWKQNISLVLPVKGFGRQTTTRIDNEIFFASGCLQPGGIGERRVRDIFVKPKGLLNFGWYGYEQRNTPVGDCQSWGIHEDGERGNERGKNSEESLEIDF